MLQTHDYHEDGDAAGFELERRNYEAGALVIEPRWLSIIISSMSDDHTFRDSANLIVQYVYLQNP